MRCVFPSRFRPGAHARSTSSGFGLNSIDLLTVVAEFPVSNSKQRLQRFARLPGGQTATALVDLRAPRLARPLHRQLRRRRVRHGVAREPDRRRRRRQRGAHRRRRHQPVRRGLVDARTGERTVLWDRHPALTMTAEDVPQEAVTSGRVLIVDCQETAAATQAARYAREAGLPTIVDVEKVRPGIGDLLQHIDAIIAAEEFPTALTGYEDPGRALEAMAREFGACVTCVTLGDEGSLTCCAGRLIRTPAFQVDCLDTTGAGDVFRGAFISACLRTAGCGYRGCAGVRQRRGGPELPGARRAGRHPAAGRGRPAARHPVEYVTFRAAGGLIESRRHFADARGEHRWPHRVCGRCPGHPSGNGT